MEGLAIPQYRRRPRIAPIRFPVHTHSVEPHACGSVCRWEGKAIRSNDWKRWFEDQAASAGKSTAGGLYVGLRLDGRVRASGEGMPPWSIFARQLAPVKGMWGGFMDGMDGKVGGN